MNEQEEKVKKLMGQKDFTGLVGMLLEKDSEIHRLKSDLTDPMYIYAQGRIRRESILARNADIDKYGEGLKTVLAHAGNAIECVDEPGKGYLREICEIVEAAFGIPK